MATTFNPPAASEDPAPRPFQWTAETYQRAWDAGVFGHEARVELVFGRVIDRNTETGPGDYHWTADAFEYACESGVLGRDARLELVAGMIIDRMAESPLHGFLATLIIEHLRTVFPLGFLVRGERLIRIAFDGDPVPDVSVVVGGPFDYRGRHATPQDTALLIEVAISSVEHDLNEKSLLYSQGGINDYWVVLPGENTIVTHCRPTPSGYAQVTRLGEDDAVSPLAAPAVSLPVRSLLGF